MVINAYCCHPEHSRWALCNMFIEFIKEGEREESLLMKEGLKGTPSCFCTFYLAISISHFLEIFSSICLCERNLCALYGKNWLLAVSFCLWLPLAAVCCCLRAERCAANGLKICRNGALAPFKMWLKPQNTPLKPSAEADGNVVKQECI